MSLVATSTVGYGSQRRDGRSARSRLHPSDLSGPVHEPSSLLDARLRTELVSATENLRQKSKTAFLYITHDLALARRFCDRLLIMKNGRIVEEGDVDQIVQRPAHQDTAALVHAAFPPPPLNRAGVACGNRNS